MFLILLQADRQAGDALLLLRNQVNLVLEQARNQKLLGSALEAKVLLHVADPAAADSLRGVNSAANGADPLRYAFITSQAQLVDSQVDFCPCVSAHVFLEVLSAGLVRQWVHEPSCVWKSRGLEVKCLEKPEQQDQVMEPCCITLDLKEQCVLYAVLCCAVLCVRCIPRLHVAFGLMAALWMHLPPRV